MTPRVLLLGGLDPTGGAGITADAAVVAAHGCQGLPIAVVLTVQNQRGFAAAHPVAEAIWRPALAAAVADGPVAVVKSGMLADPGTVAAVAAALAELVPSAPLVVDPVLGATAGGFAPGARLVAAYREHLVPRAALLLPNDPELAAFGGSAAALRALGCRAVLHKGGHAAGAECVDTLHAADSVQSFARARLPIGPVRGTGCALASAIAARLARGEVLADAVRAAGDWLHRRLQALGPPAAAGQPRCLPVPVLAG